MRVIGLTGSIAMGKSSAASYLADKGLPLWSADEVVHALYEGKAAGLIEAAFPGVVRDGVVDRALLSAKLMRDPARIAALEAIVHPLVEEERKRFIDREREAGAQLVVLDIPLLLEKPEFEDKVDVVLLMTAPLEVQRERVMKRPGMSEEKFRLIRERQLSEEEKRAHADFIVDTSGAFENTHARLDAFLDWVQTGPQPLNDRSED